MRILNQRFLVDYNYRQLNHYGEELCGDVIGVREGENFMVFVLADGLGSGIRANILANLMVEISERLTTGGLTIQEVVETVMETLPVCPIRNIAYATFTIIQLFNSGFARIYEFDNPEYLLFRNGTIQEVSKKELVIGNYRILYSEQRLNVHDSLFVFSDGITHAGMGKTLPFGLQREEVMKFLGKQFNRKTHEKYKAGQLTDKLIQHCLNLDLGEPGDDTSVLGIMVRETHKAVIFTGPPKDKALDKKAFDLFWNQPGEKIVCGGTTSLIVSRMLKKSVKVQLDSFEKDIPAMASIPGIDLATEGVITMSRVCEMLEGKPVQYEKANGAVKLYQHLVKADEVNIIAGTAINEAYQNPELPQMLSLRKNLVDKLVDILQHRWNKTVHLTYF